MKKQLRITPQREVILSELKKSKNHPSADELYERVKKKLPRISLATVYRNLEILSEAGTIKKIEISGRLKRFDWDLEQHNHIYCVQCQRVDNVDLKQHMYPHLQPGDPKGYNIDGCRIEFFGHCPDCIIQQSNKEEKMACKKCRAPALNDKQRQVLEALAKSKVASASKDIAASTNLDKKQISCQITALKKKGFVSSPARCKYEITNEGKKAIA